MRSTMDLEWLRAVCLALPNVTEQIQWGSDLLFKVHGKMFAVANTEPARVCLSFKCSPEAFAELIERPEVIPAPYLARAKWVALETPQAIGREELGALLKVSYELVLAKVPKSQRASSGTSSANNSGRSGLSSLATRGARAQNAGAPSATTRRVRKSTRKKSLRSGRKD